MATPRKRVEFGASYCVAKRFDYFCDPCRDRIILSAGLPRVFDRRANICDSCQDHGLHSNIAELDNQFLLDHQSVR
jgi:hypothetical protein